LIRIAERAGGSATNNLLLVKEGRMKRLIAIATSVLSLVLLMGPVLFAQKAATRESQYVVKGRKLFNQYCATCHGTTAKGEGPVATALKVGPPDLTALQPPGEKFPFYRVQTKIDGEKEVTAHGPSKMPVWGTVFKGTSGELQRHADVYALVKYIESIQRLN
jgi:mono/diheme cytochrome c family protein